MYPPLTARQWRPAGQLSINRPNRNRRLSQRHQIRPNVSRRRHQPLHVRFLYCVVFVFVLLLCRRPTHLHHQAVLGRSQAPATQAIVARLATEVSKARLQRYSPDTVASVYHSFAICSRLERRARQPASPGSLLASLHCRTTTRYAPPPLLPTWCLSPVCVMGTSASSTARAGGVCGYAAHYYLYFCLTPSGNLAFGLAAPSDC